MTLHFIRHGQTLANQQRLYCGATDLPLSEDGSIAIQALAKLGIYPPCEGLLFYTSGLLRTRQTLEAIYGPVPQEVLPGFAEMDFGAFEMHSHEQLQHNPDYIAWISDQTGQVACPGGESTQGFTLRVSAAFEMLKSKGRSALVVCHGGTITRLMQRLFPWEPRHFYQWQPQPGEGYSLCFTADSVCAFEEISPKHFDLKY